MSDPAAPPDESSPPLPEGTVTPSTAAALHEALEAALGEDGAVHLEDDIAGYAASLPLAHEPGSCQQYSSGTTNILCSVLHQRSGLGTDLAERLLFDSLGVSSAVWEPDATGHLACSSHLWATPRDWPTIGQFALQDGHWDGTALPLDWMRTTTTPVAIAEEEDWAAPPKGTPGIGSWGAEVVRAPATAPAG